MSFKTNLIVVVLLLAGVRVLAQQPSKQTDMPGMSKEPTAGADKTPIQEKKSDPMDANMQMGGMDHSTGGMEMSSEEDPEFGAGSGTAWAPLATTEHMWMAKWRAWDLMTHGNLILDYDHQGGPRGSGKAGAVNWLMSMQQRKVGAGKLQLREMLSAESLTFPHPGMPLLFQTGETYHGVPLVDHQHPHDVFMELSGRYVLPLKGDLKLSLYGAPVGEPALGPVAFMHRASAMETPDAPISHHLQDSTHISFGVLTAGLIYKWMKVEGSAFNGREPDERRYDFDFGPLDSASGRIDVAPTRNWALQYSFGHLRHPEALEPGNVNRQTASVMYIHDLRAGSIATSVIWGRNHKTATGTSQNSYLVESTWNFVEKNFLFTRMEVVDKDELFPRGGGPIGQTSFRVGEYTFGGTRNIVENRLGELGLGAQVSFYSMPESLNNYYGDHPVSFELFIRLRPPKMKM